MALIKCKECENEVSTTTKTCPKCGAKVRNENDKLLNRYIFFGLILLYVVIPALPEKDPTKHNEGRVSKETVTSAGILSTSRAYNPVDTTAEIFDSLYDLAKEYPEARTICLNGFIQNKDKYGNIQNTELGTLVIDAPVVEELRKFKDKSYLHSNEIITNDFSTLIIRGFK
jgi:hypothetical protein